MISLLFLLLVSYEASLFEIEEGRDLEILLDEMESLIHHPLDINSAGFGDLAKILYLTPTDCLNIIEYRTEHGPYGSTEDVLNVPGFDEALYSKIRPFITVKAKPLRIEKCSVRLRSITELPRSELSEEYYTRSEVKYGNYRVYGITEKDPFEDSFFDYYAFGFLADNGVRRYAVGKYNLDLGSGVVLSPVGSFLYSTDFRVITRERGLFPYTSVLENSGFFGAAYSDSLVLRYTVFVSQQKLDGRIDTLGFARSFDESGDHIDSLSQSRKDRISERLFGYDVHYRIADLQVSSRSYWCLYDPPFVCVDSTVQFYGDRFWTTALGLNYSARSFVIVSELARSFRNRLGGLFGFNGRFAACDVQLAGKYFPTGFYSPKGVEADDDYVGGVLVVQHRSGIADIGMTVSIDGDTETDSVKYRVQFNFEKKIGCVNAKLQTRWRWYGGERDYRGSRAFLRFTPIRHLFFDIRLEDKYVYDIDSVSAGLFAALEVGFEFKTIRMRARYGIFDTDDYDSRLYVYETDLPGIVRNRMLYDSGYYGFFYCSVRPWQLVTLSAKYSVIEKGNLLDKRVGAQLELRL